MLDQDKSKQDLIAELAETRRRLAAMEGSDAERKRAEEALRLSEGRYRALAESTRDIIFVLDPQGVLLYANPAAARCIGIPAGDIVGKRQVDLFPLEMARSQIEKIGRVFATGGVVEYDDLFHFGPAEVWLHIHLLPLRDEAGHITSVMGVCHNVTDRKRTEAALRESEERFKLFMDNSPAIAWMKDERGRYVYINKSCARRVGTPPEDRIGKTDFELWPLATAEQFWKNDQKVLSDGQVVEVVEESTLPDGNRSCCRNFKFLFQDAAGRRFVGGVGIDITQWMQAQEELQKAHDELEERVQQRTAELAKANESLEIFRQFVEASGEGFGMTDFDGRIAYANSTAARLFGEERPENMVGQNIAAYYSEDYLRRRKDEMLPALLRTGYWHVETTISPRAGKPLLIWQSTFLIRDENGAPFRIAVVIRDITDEKHAVEVLQRQHRNLKHLLQSSDHERQLIAYDIHDGLAQQLAAALMQFQAFDHLKDKNPKEAARAYEAGQTMLQQAHFEARRLIAGVRPPILDESGIVEAVAHLVHEQGRETEAKIDFHSRVSFDRLDPTLENAIYRIAQEALTNACRHSRSERISVSLSQRADRLRIEVCDGGLGFDPKTVPTNHFGLEGIRQRARLLAGKCSIRSAASKGTRVTVELPVVPRNEEV